MIVCILVIGKNQGLFIIVLSEDLKASTYLSLLPNCNHSLIILITCNENRRLKSESLVIEALIDLLERAEVIVLQSTLL